MLAVTVDWGLLNQYQGIASPWSMLPLVAMLMVSAWLIVKFRTWFRDNAGRTDDNLEMLSQFRELHQQGELSEEEYRLIKSRLARATVAANLPGRPALESANEATGSGRQAGGTDNTGEAGQNDSNRTESRTSDESPNQSSAEQMPSEMK